MALSLHCKEDRLERLTQIGMTIGFGEVVEKFPGRNGKSATVHCLTNTGVVIIKDPTESIVITAFAIHSDRLFGYYKKNNRGNPPEYLVNIVKNNEKKRKFLYG
jgi:hypothetical protein